MGFNDPLDCDFDAIDDATKSEVAAAIPQFTSVEKCYEILPTILPKLDVNNNGILDRCEDAIHLMILGDAIGQPNTEAYAMKYSHHIPHSLYKIRCDHLFNPFYF